MKRAKPNSEMIKACPQDFFSYLFSVKYIEGGLIETSAGTDERTGENFSCVSVTPGTEPEPQSVTKTGDGNTSQI